MRILYIDTSSSFLYAGIVDDDILLCEVKKEFGHNLSEEAMPEIEKLFTTNSIKPNEIDKIIVIDGPGSFTGIRIGITISKVYAWSMNIPISTVSALEVMALSANIDTLKVPMIDARRGYVFGAVYSEKNEVIISPQHIKMDELLNKIPKSKYTVISNDELDIEEDITTYSPDILKVVTTYKNKEEKNPHSVNPEYLKLTEAEENKK